MKKIKLGDVLDVKRGASLPGEYYAEKGTLLRLTLGNFNYPNGGFKKNTSKEDLYFTGPIREEFILKKGDIITPLTEQVAGLLGETATIPKDDLYIQTGDIGLIIPDETKIAKRFAYYLVSSPSVKKQLGAAAQQTKIRHTSPDAIKACEAWIPETISDQERIAGLLDSINESITTNFSIWSDLEAMAKLLYDYWFVQFDFPDENGRPYKSSGGNMVWNEQLKRKIPGKWIVSKLGDHCKFENGDRSENYPSGDDFIPDGIPFIAGGAIKENGIDYCELRYISEEKYNSLRAGKANYGDILMTLRGSLAKYVYSPFEKIAIASALVIVRPDDVISDEYLYCLFTSEYYIRLMNNYNNGSVQANLSVDVVKTFPIIIPDNLTMKRFNDVLHEIKKMKMELEDRNRELTSLRDFLLPMLMNGQVKVNPA